MTFSIVTPATAKILFRAEYGVDFSGLRDDQLKQLIADYARYETAVLLHEMNKAYAHSFQGGW